MDCRTAAALLQPCFDGELDEGTAATVRAHIAGCAACSREMAALQALREGMKRSLPRYTPPQSLRDRIRASASEATSTEQRRPPAPRRFLPRWLAVAASLLLVASLSVGVTRTWMGSSTEPASTELLLHDLVSSHLRALAATNSVDVPSSDRHTVRPWFAGRVEVAPPALDLSQQGFELLGGRVDYVGGRRVAVLVYKHGQHVVDLYVLPDDMPGATANAVGAGAPVMRQGLNLIQRRVGGVQVWAVSDLDPQEMADFGEALTKAP
ncbi:MAG: anti-sigma factor family protein [Hypericibacter sp.]